MKQIPILSGKAMVVEVPEESYAFDIVGSTWLECHRHTDDLGFTTDMIDLPPGNWRIIGMLNEVGEEQAAELVDGPHESGIEQYTKPDDLTGWTVSEAPMGTKYSKGMYKGYRDYTKDPDSYSVRGVNPFGTALESLDSAILSAGWFFSNPYVSHPDTWDYLFEAMHKKEEDVQNWETAQSRVLDRSRCLLLGRESN